MGKPRNRFTLLEQKKIRQLYPLATWETILAALPDHDRKHIISWAEYNGIARETELAKKRVKKAPEAKGKTKAKRKDESGPATPVLDANKKKKKSDGPTVVGQMLHQMKQLPGGHPRRVAYAQAARTGNGQDALKAWLSWPAQQKGGTSEY